MPKTKATKNTATPIIIKNHLYLIPEINNITKVINKYINTTPVSGCINVSMLGTKTTIAILKH